MLFQLGSEDFQSDHELILLDGHRGSDVVERVRDLLQIADFDVPVHHEPT